MQLHFYRRISPLPKAINKETLASFSELKTGVSLISSMWKYNKLFLFVTHN